MEAAAGQLKEGCDPYRLVLPAERETLAEYYADELRARLTGRGRRAGRAVPGGRRPRRRCSSRRTTERRPSTAGPCAFRWFWTGASSAKWKAGDQSFPVVRAERGRVALARGLRRAICGCCRAARPGGRPAQADQDPAAVVFGLGYGPVHESLPFAAAVLAAVRDAQRRARPLTRPRARRDPADIAERIRHLGELHQAGLVTDEEFSVKKAELLAEL